jgi:hypothetical protein
VRTEPVQRSIPRLLPLTAILLTLGFAGVEEGIVLCFGGDGHVAIEMVGLEGCAAVAESAEHAASAIVIRTSSSHCGPCIDLALASSTATEGIQAAKRTPSALAGFTLPEHHLPIPHRRAAISYARTTAFASEKTHTVVIRC